MMSAHSSTQPKLAIFFQLDPLNPTIGGIQTCIKYVIKYAPARLRIQLVGIAQGRRASDAGVGRWQTVELYGREFDFLPLLNIADDNVRSRIPTTVKYALALRKHLRQPPSAAIYQADFYQFHRIEPTLFTGSLGGTKLLYIHNDIHQEVKGATAKGGILWKRIPWAYFALERRLVQQFDRILSCNSRSAQLYQQQYPDIAQRVSYLPNTFDSELFYPLSDANKAAARRQLAHKLSLPASTRFILFAGRLHPQKRPDLLIQSMAALVDASDAESLENVHLLVVGKGELTAAVRAEIARFQLASRVSLLAPMSQAELAVLYQIGEIFALTSAYEGLARGSLEALACGTPVVTTRAGETPNFLTSQSGIVCEEQARDKMPGAIARAWRQVLENTADYPASACAQVAQPYNAARVVSTLYGDLLQDWSAESSRLPSKAAAVC